MPVPSAGPAVWDSLNTIQQVYFLLDPLLKLRSQRSKQIIFSAFHLINCFLCDENFMNKKPEDPGSMARLDALYLIKKKLNEPSLLEMNQNQFKTWRAVEKILFAS